MAFLGRVTTGTEKRLWEEDPQIPRQPFWEDWRPLPPRGVDWKSAIISLSPSFTALAQRRAGDHLQGWAGADPKARVAGGVLTPSRRAAWYPGLSPGPEGW